MQEALDLMPLVATVATAATMPGRVAPPLTRPVVGLVGPRKPFSALLEEQAPGARSGSACERRVSISLY